MNQEKQIKNQITTRSKIKQKKNNDYRLQIGSNYKLQADQFSRKVEDSLRVEQVCGMYIVNFFLNLETFLSLT